MNELFPNEYGVPVMEDIQEDVRTVGLSTDRHNYKRKPAYPSVLMLDQNGNEKHVVYCSYLPRVMDATITTKRDEKVNYLVWRGWVPGFECPLKRRAVPNPGNENPCTHGQCKHYEHAKQTRQADSLARWAAIQERFQSDIDRAMESQRAQHNEILEAISKSNAPTQELVEGLKALGQEKSKRAKKETPDGK